jgi:hypothetical protein
MLSKLEWTAPWALHINPNKRKEFGVELSSIFYCKLHTAGDQRNERFLAASGNQRMIGTRLLYFEHRESLEEADHTNQWQQ